MISTVVCLALLASSVCGQTNSPPHHNAADAKQAKLADLVKRLLQVNSVWLDPRPARLSYTVTGSAKVRGVETTPINRVWIDGDKARWEMETEFPPSPTAPKQVDYTLLIRSGEEIYVRAPRESTLLQRQAAHDARALKQGISWSTAMHAIARDGLPKDCRIVETHATDNGQIVVLLMKFEQAGSHVALGLYQGWLGQASMPLGRVLLQIRLPDHVPLVEDYVDRDVRIEYGPKFLTFDERRAPETIKFISTLSVKRQGKRRKTKSWEMEAHFQKVEGLWLLDRASNRQDGNTVTQIMLSNISTATINPKLFEFPAGK
jgi:hypothetical protein